MFFNFYCCLIIFSQYKGHFVVTILHCFSILLHSTCGYPKGLSAMILIAVVALLFGTFFKGSPNDGGGLVKKINERIQSFTFPPVGNKRTRARRKNNFYDESDHDLRNFNGDRLEGKYSYDDLIATFIVQRWDYTVSIYVPTGRSFP